MTQPAPHAAAPHGTPHLAHHFETPRQQFESGKLGIWLFLTTEVLLFAGLFCAYAVYRANHPEIFAYAHLYLSKTLGAVNTVVLIFSSFTMAAAVHAAQVGARRWLVALLAVTLLCGCGFLSIKFVEYKEKWEEGLLTGQSYRPEAPPPGANLGTVPIFAPGTVPIFVPTKMGLSPSASATASGTAGPERSTIAPAAVGPRGISPRWLTRKTAPPEQAWIGPEPYNVQLFFGIYFAMTGLHGVHVVAGMGAIAWILARAWRGEFGPEHFAPVDFTGLYWHLVDLVWIFLFPLLYLIA